MEKMRYGSECSAEYWYLEKEKQVGVSLKNAGSLELVACELMVEVLDHVPAQSYCP